MGRVWSEYLEAVREHQNEQAEPTRFARDAVQDLPGTCGGEKCWAAGEGKGAE